MNYNLVIIGGGPAGTGILFKALKDNSFDILLDKGLAIIEKGSELMIGSIDQYQVNSDTLSGVFLECIEGSIGERINTTLLEQEIEEIKSYEGKAIPLPYLKKYFVKLGRILMDEIANHPNCDIYLNTKIERINQDAHEKYEIALNDHLIYSNHVAVTTGGTPSFNINYHWQKRKYFSLEKYASKMIHSDTLIKGEINQILKKINNNSTIVILGGGHSGFSSAYYLLDYLHPVCIKDNMIKIYANKSPKIFFNSKNEAIKNKYFDFEVSDFCKITNRLYRFAGLRMDGRSLYMKMLGLGENLVEKRVVFKLQDKNENEFIEDMENANLIIQALGYVFNMIPVYDENKQQILFKGKEDGRWVNEQCQLLNQNNQPIKNLYACGLATGFIPPVNFGGEPSFEGQTNGIWFYQNIIGGIILDQVI
jgi:hypothetical protein